MGIHEQTGSRAGLTDAQVQWLRKFLGRKSGDVPTGGHAASAQAAAPRVMSTQSPMAHPAKASALNFSAPVATGTAQPAAPGAPTPRILPAANNGIPSAAPVSAVAPEGFVEPNSNPPPATLDPAASPVKINGPDWHSAADIINADASPYGTISYMKIQAARINSDMISLEKALTSGTAASAELQKRVAAQNAGVKPVDAYLKSPKTAATQVEGALKKDGRADRGLADEARTAEAVVAVKNLTEKFARNVKLQMKMVEERIELATELLHATELKEQAAELRKSAEAAAQGIEGMVDMAETGIEGGMEGGPEGAAVGMGLAMAKNVIKIFADNGLNSKIEALEEQATGAEKSAYTKDLASAKAAVDELEHDCTEIIGGASLSATVAERDRRIATDHFDKEVPGCKFKFTPVTALLTATRTTASIAQAALDAWQNAARFMGRIKAEFGIFECVNAAGELQLIDGYTRPGAAAGVEGFVDGPEADRMRGARLDEFNSQVTQSILDAAAKNTAGAQKHLTDATELHEKLQTLRDTAFEALASSPV